MESLNLIELTTEEMSAIDAGGPCGYLGIAVGVVAGLAITGATVGVGAAVGISVGIHAAAIACAW